MGYDPTGRRPDPEWPSGLGHSLRNESQSNDSRSYKDGLSEAKPIISPEPAAGLTVLTQNLFIESASEKVMGFAALNPSYAC